LDTDLLFPGALSAQTGRPFEIEKAWRDVRRRAELDDFVFHDLRHSCASYLAMNGATMIEIAEVLGHKTLEMVKRYSHLAESHTAGVVERMSQKIFRA
jgi:integrase